MAFSFNVRRPANLASTLKKTAQTVRGGGGEFSGDEESGSFSGSGVKGTYSVGSSDITIKITQKPFLATESMVKNTITAYFKE
jgi:hypothetical protein